MSDQNEMQLFEDQPIRTAWDAEREEWLFSVVDVVGVLSESKDPAAIRDAILAEADRVRAEGLDEGLFQRLKKAAYGAYVRGLNSFENLCVSQARAYFAGQDPWTFPELYDGMTRQDAEAFLRDWLRPEHVTLSVIRPEEAEE